MAQLFKRPTSLPSAQGLMVFARRENLIGGLLSGLSHEDDGLRTASIRPVLMAYLQSTGKDLTGAANFVNDLDEATLRGLTDQLVALADQYHWE